MKQSEQNFFARRISDLRKQKKVSSRKMSMALGQNESYINRIECGINYPSMDVFFRICEYLGITPAEFFEADIEYPAKLREAKDNLKQLDGEHLDIVNAVIKGFMK